jgi:hypothetical protein
MRDNPGVGAEIMAVIEAIRDRLFRQARAAPVSGTGAGGKTAGVKVIVRVDLPALSRGQVVTKGRQVLGVAHLGRRPTVRQQTALEWLYPTWCGGGLLVGGLVGNDHRVDWARSHVTVLDLLDRLCSARPAPAGQTVRIEEVGRAVFGPVPSPDCRAEAQRVGRGCATRGRSPGRFRSPHAGRRRRGPVLGALLLRLDQRPVADGRPGRGGRRTAPNPRRHPASPPSVTARSHRASDSSLR